MVRPYILLLLESLRPNLAELQKLLEKTLTLIVGAYCTPIESPGMLYAVC